MKTIVRLLFLVTVAVIVISDIPPNSAHLLASGQCACAGGADAYTYSGPTYVGHYGNYGTAGIAGSEYQCADMCQIWINANVGHVACSNYGLGRGTGYVIESWGWSYFGYDPPHENYSYVQQYDCGDI